MDNGTHNEIVLPEGMWAKLQKYLFEDESREYVCYILCGAGRQNQKLRLLGKQLFLPEPDDYIRQSRTGVSLRREVWRDLLTECQRLGLGLIDVHSHPFSNDNVAFSGIDDADEAEKAAWFAENLPHTNFGSIVCGKRSYAARIRFTYGRIVDEPLAVRTLDVPLQPRSDVRPRVEASFVDRHVRAFGSEGQARLGAAHVAVVGVGGLGSAIALGLARLGVRTFTLVDHDRAEPHNLNRLIGMRAHDARAKTLKTRLVRRELRAIDPQITCRRMSEDVCAPGAWRSLLECDLIVAATDNHSSRFLLNALSEQYLIPQVSIGALIEVGEDGNVGLACGHVRVVLPGDDSHCMLCSQIVDTTEVYYESLAPEHRGDAANRGYIANFDQPAPSVVHLNGVLANLALVEIHNLFSGFKPYSPYLFFDLLRQDIVSLSESKDHCSICSPAGSQFAMGDLIDLDHSARSLARS